MVLIAIGLAVGLGVGLTNARRNCGRCASSAEVSYPSTTNTPTAAPPAGTGTVTDGVWQPSNGTTWQIQLAKAPIMPATDGAEVWDIDLFDSTASTISHIQSQGSKVICYFSAGSVEDWRSDASKFAPSDIGNDLSGWPGEKWINIASANVRSIMVARLDLAKSKGCNGVDPDNVDGYNNDNGLDLTTQDTIDYMTYLAAAAKERGLSIGLKNALEVIPQLVDKMQWAVTEQCLQYDECDRLQVFIGQKKPVFHVEYPKGEDQNTLADITGGTYDDICDSGSTDGFSTLIKNMNLDGFTQRCPATLPRGGP